jgi:polar amino acid transport system substrate-binding protein
VGLLFVLTLSLTDGLQLAPALAQDLKCEPDRIGVKYPGLAGKIVKVGAGATDKPYSYLDPTDFNKVIGLDPDLARAALACIGLSVTFSPGPWMGLLPAVIADQTDVMWDHLFYTPERAKQVDFVIYMVGGSGVMVKKGNLKNIHSLDDLCGARAGAILGGIEHAKLREVAEKCSTNGRPTLEVTTYPDRPSGIRLVENDRLDAMVGIVDDTSAYDPQIFERAFRFVTGTKIGVGVNKSQKELAKAIFDALRILRANGTEESLYKTYDIDRSYVAPIEISP